MSEQRVIESTQRTQQQPLQQAVVQQTTKENQAISINDPLSFLMGKVQSIEGSMRRQTGDIAQIKNKLLENQSLVEDVTTDKEYITREEFNKAINYVCALVQKQSSDNQQVLTNHFKELKQHFGSINPSTATSSNVFNPKANLTQITVGNKMMSIFPSQTSVRVSLPLLGDIHLPLPIPVKFIKPALIIGLVLFALIIIFLGSK